MLQVKLFVSQQLNTLARKVARGDCVETKGEMMGFLTTERLSEFILMDGPIAPWGEVYLPEPLRKGPHFEFTKKRLEHERKRKKYERQLKGSKERQDEVSAFLSYSHHDRKWAHGLSLYLEMIESDLYVDLRDDSLPRDVGGETAHALRERISQRDKFIVLRTDKTKESAWVPWELGLDDGLKGRENVVVFPLASVTTFECQEYFDVYSRVEESAMEMLVVVDPQRKTSQEFSHWLHGVEWSRFRNK